MPPKVPIRYGDAYAGCVLCASLFSWIALILAIFCAASPWWSWGVVGNSSDAGGVSTRGNSEVAASPYIAGVAWVQQVVSDATTSTYPLYWSTLASPPASTAVCGNATSQVFLRWAKPFGYCVPAADGSGWVFQAPKQPFNVQGLTVSACVFAFLAAMFGCAQGALYEAEPAPDFTRRTGACAAFCSLLAWLMSLSAFSLWADWSWAQAVNSGSYMPVWISPTRNIIAALPVSMVFGPAFGTCIAAFCMSFFAFIVYSLSVFDFFGAREYFQEEAPGKAAPAPGAGAAPAPAPAAGAAPEAGATPVVQV